MNNKLMKSAFATLAAVTIGSTVAPVASAATENSDNNTKTQTFIVPKFNGSVNSIVPKSTVTTSEFSKEITKAGSVTYENGIKTFKISDDALERTINKVYGDSFSTELAKKHHSGVTKVKYYGHGNINFYASKALLNSLRGKGFKYGFSIVLGIIAGVTSVPSMGVATSVITSIASTLVGAMMKQVRPYKAGRVYKIRHWKYAGWRYQ